MLKICTSKDIGGYIFPKTGGKLKKCNFVRNNFK